MPLKAKISTLGKNDDYLKITSLPPQTHPKNIILPVMGEEQAAHALWYVSWTV
jgi:hypothetical protein